MSESNQVSNGPLPTVAPAPSAFRSILETCYAGLRILFRNFPVGFNDNDEFKAELGVDAVRRELRYIGIFLMIPWVVSLLFALKLKLVPILVTAALSYGLYRVLKALVRCSRDSLTPADKARVLAFIEQISTEQYREPHREVSKQVKKDLQDYKASVTDSFTYDSLDRLVAILNRTLRSDADMFRCAFNVNYALKDTVAKESLLKRLCDALK